MAKDMPNPTDVFTREDYSLIAQGLILLSASHKRRTTTEKDASVRAIYEQLRVKADAVYIKVRGIAPVEPGSHS